MPSGGMGVLSKGTYDPWEALEVEWDVGGDAEGMDRVSPWEIEVSLRSSVTLQCASTDLTHNVCSAMRARSHPRELLQLRKL